MLRRRLLLAPLAGGALARPGTGSHPSRGPARQAAAPARCGPQPAFGHRLPGRAGRPFAITRDHRDAGVLHNVAIDTDARTTRALFRGRLVDGVATVTDRVPALPASTYYFRCDVHPST